MPVWNNKCKHDWEAVESGGTVDILEKENLLARCPWRGWVARPTVGSEILVNISTRKQSIWLPLVYYERKVCLKCNECSDNYKEKKDRVMRAIKEIGEEERKQEERQKLAKRMWKEGCKDG